MRDKEKPPGFLTFESENGYAVAIDLRPLNAKEHERFWRHIARAFNVVLPPEWVQREVDRLTSSVSIPK